MRLSVIFLGVLAASILLTSLAAWGITYGTSYNRVTTMSSEFTTLAHQSVAQFEAFVSDLLQDNAKLVDDILMLERNSGEARIQDTKISMLNTIGTLVNYTANATDQSQAQMNAVVDTFASLMGSVVADFKGVATGYAAQLRAALATKASAALLQTLTVRNATMQRFQMLSSMGLLNLSKAPWEPIGEDDCTVLGVLCAATAEMGTAEPVTLALATGRSYTCRTGKEASISVITLNGTEYTEQLLKWVPDGSASGTRQRCLTPSAATVVTVGQSCPLPQGCGCGQDQRCAMWYTGHAADTGPSFTNGAAFLGPYGTPTSSISYSLFSTGPAASLIAVVANNIEFSGIDAYLAALVTVPGTVLAMMHNDTNLSVVGTTGPKCASNATPPGDQTLPTWSGLRSCDSGLRAVAQWLAQNRSTMPSSVSLQVSGVVWDVFLTNLGFMAYYCIIGTPLAVINAAVDASDARAAAQLTDVRARELGRVAASGAATKAYMAAVGAQNVRASEAMQDSFVAQIQSLENSSRVVLSTSHQRSSAQVDQMAVKQTEDIEALTARHLSAMAVTTGWTLGVVFGILLGVLLCSAWGTVRVTNDLTNIIGLMEDVADLKVEDLAVPRTSHITEVARIETAFQVLVRRLAEYKSYIPAGVFEKMQKEGTGPDGSDSEGDPAVGGDGTARPLSSSPSGGKLKSVPLLHDARASAHTLPLSSNDSSASSHASSRTAARHRAAALAVYVFDFTEALVQMAPGTAKALLSQFITHIHEAALQNRGNVDFVAGDQIVVTFNAHVPCSDPASAAVAAALEMRRLLQPVARERLKFQIGISFGPVLSGSVGYAKFRSMATLGGAMKAAAMISQMAGFEGGAVLVDSSMEERMKYVYDMRPATLVHFPQLKAPAGALPTSRCVYLVLAKRQMDEDEWLYQVNRMAPPTDWNKVFNEVVTAPTVQEGRRHLQLFLELHPEDSVALRLRDRLGAWTPGLGLPLFDRAEHDDWRAPRP